MKQNKKHTYVSISTTDGKRHSEACGRGRGGVVGEKGKEREGRGIAFCQRGKCSGGGVKEGCRVEGRGTLQQLVSIIHRGGAS